VDRERLGPATSAAGLGDGEVEPGPERNPSAAENAGDAVGKHHRSASEASVRTVDARAVPRSARRAARVAARRARTELDVLASRRGRADLALFHEFEPPPAGGGHQFLRALSRELGARGLALEGNRISGETPACLFNSFNFDFHRLRRFARPDVRMVHRVDGPIGAYRGFDDGTDARIVEVNRELADATVLQSHYSLARHRELGYELRDPNVIPNTVDPEIFHPPESHETVEGRPLRVIASSWSENPRKGEDVLLWIDRNLDFGEFSVTFMGQTRASFERITRVGPLDSHGVARALREHDVYLAPSRDDPCSNALLEALACGLPAAYRESGGHPELVGQGGLPFTEPEELPSVLERLAADLGSFRSRIRIPSLASVADRYLEVLGLSAGARP
jgi:glycosyltransferase involved in cell wall biosynthesis